MPVTRSASKKDGKTTDDEIGQAQSLGESTRNSKAVPRDASQYSKQPDAELGRDNESKKRNLPANNVNSTTPSKRRKTDSRKQVQVARDNATDTEHPILINRSPVLQLWGASVAQFLHPDEPWQLCLSIGGSVATLCAISKGRAIGQVEPNTDTVEGDQKPSKRNAQNQKDIRDLKVMGFPMCVKNSVVIVDGKPKPLKEDLLQGKYGGESNYQRAKVSMQEALQTWQYDKDELDKKAFHMYEKFRPNVPKGTSGWGKKGELDLQKLSNTVKNR